ncbi:conserved hypothetical protein [Thermobaculum terrenum ATCC BAA-798]|uniref:Aldose 1-epimerase n=1 Tax=Thermobaculum terrenum (strain ATCC BAA-798 / CCMEE 7001 / YNP1) TaxID=525904 RepID=D1CHA6_THET1|nr:aldose 1-epimerase family protein [Thermobaculum terrenum]ACZ43127.1 conserved hypothetical protein [Thermobaculum terrenum ATCC BAA-798]
MTQLYGKQYSKDELERMTGYMFQLAGIQLGELTDGRARGMRVATVRTGSGFEFQVLLDRAMDIWLAEHAGRPLAWLHPALGGPALYEPRGDGWARTFGGGLVTTCGLTHFGHPEVDQGEELGLHGRISHCAASSCQVREGWQGDDYTLELTGVTRQAVLFGEYLTLERTISTRLGANHLAIHDRVRNDGYRPTPHMILYHCNFGFPVVSPDSEVLLADEAVRPRDEDARAGVDRWHLFEAPQADFREQVFFHQPRVGADGMVRAAIVNRQLGFGAFIRYRAAELPCLAQWKMMGARDYVCALEPANYWETPRHVLREEGRLRFLQPGEEVDYYLEIGALTSVEEVQAFEREIGE